MMINGICCDCKYFQHDCGNGSGCYEYCNNPNPEIVERFCDFEDLEKCEGFEKWLIIQ